MTCEMTKHTDDELAFVFGETKTLGYVSLQHGVSKGVKEKKAFPGQFLLNGALNLGEEFGATILAMRPKAVHYPEDGEPVVSFDLTSPEFREIADKANKWVKGYYAGSEFLLFVHEKDAFATLYCARTSQRSGRALFALMKAEKPALIRSRLVKGRQNDYHVVEVAADEGSLILPSDSAKLEQAQAGFQVEIAERPDDLPER